MVYKHPYFKLDTESKKVFDENGKELALTGNAYRLLVFLCDKNNVTITDINDHFDPAGAKDYSEDHIRQYRYKINSIIGHGIAAYKNNVYSINGVVSKYENFSDSELIIPKTRRTEKIPPKEEAGKKTIVKQKKGKLSNKEKLTILFSVVFLTIFSTVVLGDKNKNAGTVSKSSSSEEKTADLSSTLQNDMVLIPAGEFIMGITEQQILETWRQNDGGWEKKDYISAYPQRKITLGDFYIDKKEISNGDYKMFVEATRRAAPSLWDDDTLNLPSQPVVGVDWNDADAYCRWIEKRLPTEAEWEKAARGTDGRTWPWGNVWDPTKDNHGKGTGYGFDESDGYQYTAPVGTELGVSPYGVLNMAGNVYEWTADDFNAYPENDKYIQEDFEKGFKTLRGGAYDDGISEQRASTRCGFRKDYEDVDVGFRCAKDK